MILYNVKGLICRIFPLQNTTITTIRKPLYGLCFTKLIFNKIYINENHFKLSLKLYNQEIVPLTQMHPIWPLCNPTNL